MLLHSLSACGKYIEYFNGFSTFYLKSFDMGYAGKFLFENKSEKFIRVGDMERKALKSECGKECYSSTVFLEDD